MVLDSITEVTIVAKLGKSTVTIKIPDPRKEMGEVYHGLKSIIDKRMEKNQAQQKSRCKQKKKLKQINKNVTPTIPIPPEWTKAIEENKERQKEMERQKRERARSRSYSPKRTKKSRTMKRL